MRINPLPLILLCCITLVACNNQRGSDATIEAAQGYLEDKDYRLAILTAKNILKENPGNVSARLILGRSYIPLGDGPSAEKEFNKAAELGAGESEFLPHLIMAYVLQGKLDEAIARATPIAGADSIDNAKILTAKGHAFNAAGEYTKGGDAYRQAIGYLPDHVDAHIGLARLAMIRNDISEINASLSKLITMAPDNAEVWILNGENQARAQNFAEAETSYQKALVVLGEKQLSFMGFSAKSGLIRTQLIQNKLEEALVNVNQLLAVQPENVLALYLRALIAFEQKDYLTSQEKLRSILSKSERHMPSQLLMGSVQYALGNYEQARHHLLIFVNEIPSHIQARKLLATVQMHLNKPEEAYAALKSINTDNVIDSELLTIMGKAAMTSGEYARGIELYKKAIKQSPDTPGIRAELGRLYLNQGEYKKAIEELEKISGDLESDARKMIIYARIREQDYEKALTLARQMAAEAPRDPAIPVIIGVVELNRGDRGKARQQFQNAIALEKGHVQALLNLARMDMEDGNDNLAEQWLSDILEKNPKSMPALMGMAQIADKRNDNKAALKWLEKAVDENPSSIAPVTVLVNYYVNAQQYQKAEATVSAAEKRLADNPEIQNLKVRLLVSQGKFQESIPILRLLIDSNTTDSRYYLQLASIYEQLRRPERIREVLLEAKSKAADSSSIALALATFESRQGNHEKALQYVETLKNGRTAALAYVLEGDIYNQMQQYQSAIKSFEKGRAQEDTASLTVKLVQAKLKIKDTPGAKADIKRWVEQHPNDLAGLMPMANLYMQMGLNNEAINIYTHVIKADPRSHVSYNNLAWLYHLGGDKRALPTAKTAYDLAPQSAEVMDTYGWLLVLNGDSQQGIALLRDALVRSNGHGEIKIHLADALIRQGKGTSEAKSLVSSLLDTEQYKNHPEVQKLKQKLEL